MTNITNILIIEDEPLAAKDLQKHLRSIEPAANILSVLPSLHEATAWLSSNPEPDLLFCDIQLADGMSFDLFHRARIDCPVIFTTAFDEYALRAFKLNSIDYLLKPIDSEELEQALAKFHRWKARHNESGAPSEIAERIAVLLQDLNLQELNLHAPSLHASPPKQAHFSSPHSFKTRFLVHGKGGILIIPVEETALFLKDEVIYLCTLNGKRHLTDFQTMEEIEELINPAEFFRANRQTIVRMAAVEGFKADFTGKVRISIKEMPQLSIDVSREKAGAFKKWLLG